MEFRNLTKNEIDVRVGKTNKGGVYLLLYKDARCDMNILDETVGPFNWMRHHSRDNANCIVSIWDKEKKMWIEKEDTGTESSDQKEKGLASDSFKRACTNIGIGRELYTAPEIFISKDDLKHFDEKDGRWFTYDNFKVAEINYFEGEKVIKDVSIAISKYSDIHHVLKFSNDAAAAVTTVSGSKTSAVTSENKADASTSSVKLLFKDDEVLLLGNCRGKKFGDVKDTEVFKSFLNWVKTSNTNYADAAQKEQFARLKKLSQEI